MGECNFAVKKAGRKSAQINRNITIGGYCGYFGVKTKDGFSSRKTEAKENMKINLGPVVNSDLGQKGNGNYYQREIQLPYSPDLPPISLKERASNNIKGDKRLNTRLIQDEINKSGIGKIELKIKDEKLNTLKLKIELERIKNPPPEPNPYLLLKTC